MKIIVLCLLVLLVACDDHTRPIRNKDKNKFITHDTITVYIHDTVFVSSGIASQNIPESNRYFVIKVDDKKSTRLI